MSPRPSRPLQGRYPDVDIGSYPFYRNGRYGTSLVCRSADEARLKAATAELRAMLAELSQNTGIRLTGYDQTGD